MKRSNSIQYPLSLFGNLESELVDLEIGKSESKGRSWSQSAFRRDERDGPKSTRAVMTLAFSDKKCSWKLVFDASRFMQS